MIDREIYIITDYNKKYELCTINREYVFEFKTQKDIIEKIKEKIQ